VMHIIWVPCDAYRLGKACYAFWGNEVFCQMNEFMGLVMHIAGPVMHMMGGLVMHI